VAAFTRIGYGEEVHLRRAHTEATQFLIDPSTPEGQSAGLSQPSAVKCENLFTVSQNEVQRIVGHLSDVLVQRLNDCLKVTALIHNQAARRAP
jgi:hypothetical protein